MQASVIVFALLDVAFFVSAGIASVQDAKTRTLPNKVLLAMFALACVKAFLLYLWVHMLPASLLAAVFLVAVLVAFELCYRKVTKKCALGMGDIKLVGVWCAFAGIFAALFGFCAGLLGGAVFSAVRKQKTFAAGPWISCATALCYLATLV